MGKNIALFFDGTWNRPQEDGGTEANTNVRKLFLATENSPRQVARYICGVGSGGGRIHSAVAGAGGLGVSANIQKGYEKLVKHFKAGDHLFLFGFSRGAYTARSLAGFLNHVGLLLASHIEDVPKAFELYKSRANVQDSELWPFLRQLIGRDNLEPAPVPVYLIGAWDTVGRLGIPDPLGIIPDRVVRFHRTDLPKNVTHARHALALHELRWQFEPVLWTSFDPKVQTLKQVWFPGAHCDVGGGYKDTRLSDIALRWMTSEAMRPDGSGSGLHVNEMGLSMQPDSLAPVHHELKKWFALNPAVVRSALKKWPVPAADTLEVAESARNRCWDPARAGYRAWRPDVQWAFNRIDCLTLQLDLWTRYNRPSLTLGAKPWWARLRPKHIVDIITRARQLVAARPLIGGPSATVTIRSGQPLEQSLCVLFLYAGVDLVRDLIASYDQGFKEAPSDLASVSYDDAKLRRQAAAWMGQLDFFEKALSELGRLLPQDLGDAYRATVWPQGAMELGVRGALRVTIFQLTSKPIRF